MQDDNPTRRTVLRTGALAAATLATTGVATGSEHDCGTPWHEFKNEPYREFAFPDTNVTYYRYIFEFGEGDDFVLRLTGRFPYGRYMGFTAYDADTAAPHDSIIDEAITPDDGGSIDYPNRPEAGEETPEYTVWVVPESRKATAEKEAENVVGMPEDSGEREQYVALWYRIYVPETDEDGGVGLPEVAAFDEVDGTPVDCPPKWPGGEEHFPFEGAREGNFLENLPPKPVDEQFSMYAGSGDGLWANGNTDYLATRFNRAHGNVAILRFRAPDTPLNADGANEDVRYWSLCLGETWTTTTSTCLADYQVDYDVNPDGTRYVTVVVGPAQLRPVVEPMANVNFVPMGYHADPVLIYRNLVTREDPPFEGDLGTVEEPPWPPTPRDAASGDLGPEDVGTCAADPTACDAYAAEQYIGTYAPVGEICTAAELLAGECDPREYRHPREDSA